MDIFCPKHSNCEESIEVITKILSKNDPLKFKQISEEFNSKGFFKVKDLAKTTLGKASLMALDGDPLAKLYNAIQTYDVQYANQLSNAKLEYLKGHYDQAKEICKKMFTNQSDFNVLLVLAASYYQCEEYEKAKECYENACDLCPNSSEVISGLGLYYWKNSQYKEANECFYKSVCATYYSPNMWINLLNALLKCDKMGILDDMCFNMYTINMIFDQFLSMFPNSCLERNIFGQYLLRRNKINEAKYQFKFAKCNAPNHAETWKNLGDIYLTLDKNTKAIHYYETALTLNHNPTTIFKNLGLVYYNLSQYEKAIDVLEKLIKILPSDFTGLYLLADTYFEQKNIPLAITTYEMCVKLKPDDFRINAFLGIINYFIDNKQEAKKYFKKAIKIKPDDQIYSFLMKIYIFENNYKKVAGIFILWGDSCFEQNDFKNASSYYNYAIKIDLDFDIAEMHWKLGIICYQLNLFDEALLRYKQCIDLKPNFPNVYCDCALLFEKQQLFTKAIEYYKMAVQLDPNQENALYNMTILEERLGHFENVVSLLKKQLEFNADDADVVETCCELGNHLYKALGNPIEALIYYNRALVIDSSCVNIYLAMGNIFIELENYNDALKCFYTAAELEPMCVVAHTNIGSIHMDKHNFNDAIQFFKTALHISPDFPKPYCNLVQCLQHVCDWSNYNGNVEKLKEILLEQLDNDEMPSLSPYHCLLYPISPEIIKRIALKYGEQHIEKPYIAKKLTEKYTYPPSVSSNECIRVGYVCSDFANHPLTQLIQSHEKNKFEIFYYTVLDDSSSFCSEISIEDNHLRNIFKLNAVAIANKINSDGIHILVNLNGYTKGGIWNEIFTLRPAPIQVSWLGYPCTSGSSFIDYFITDAICSPLEFEHMYTEKLAYMNRTVLIGNHKQLFSSMCPRIMGSTNNMNSTSTVSTMNNGEDMSLLEKSPDEWITNNTSMYSIKIHQDKFMKCYTRQMYNLPEDVIVYCNFSRLYKIDPATFVMWMTILKKVPKSVLWLLRFPEEGENNLRKYAAAHEIDESRIIFSDLEPQEDHMRRIQLADIFLDTPLWNGHKTCLDAVWAGVPIVTLPRTMFASRVAASLMTTVKCEDMIAKDENDYVLIAMRLGLDSVYLKTTKSLIWEMKSDSKLFDYESYIKEIECVYQRMCVNYNERENLIQLN